MDIDWVKYKELALEHGLNWGGKILLALAIFVIGRWVARAITSAIKNVMQKKNVDPALTGFATSLIYSLLLVFVVIAAIGKLGIQTTSLVAIVGAAGLAVGLALQGSLSNFASGVLIIIFRPFSIGDYVEAGGTAGVIKEISVLTTVLFTPDNKKIIVPNSAIMSGTITNYSANATRRLDLKFGVSYSDDLNKVIKVLTEMVEADPRCLKDPAPTIAVLEHGDSSVNVVCRPWVATADYWAVLFDFHKNVKLRFDEEGISIPFPQRDVHLFPTGSSVPA